MDQNRQDLVDNAIKFLRDPKVQEASLAKKTAFLESKGLTNSEIEEALSKATNNSSAPQLPSRDQNAHQIVNHTNPWTSFAYAVVGMGALSYGVYHICKVFCLIPEICYPIDRLSKIRNL
jgi:peroxin-14